MIRSNYRKPLTVPESEDRSHCWWRRRECGRWIARHTEEAYRWAGSFEEKGFREAVRERDAPWRDYGERPKD